MIRLQGYEVVAYKIDSVTGFGVHGAVQNVAVPAGGGAGGGQRCTSVRG